MEIHQGVPQVSMLTKYHKTFSEWFVDWNHWVLCDKSFLNFMEIHQGVPQGSILDPLLFSLYTSQAGLYIKGCKYYFYADYNLI